VREGKKGRKGRKPEDRLRAHGRGGTGTGGLEKREGKRKTETRIKSPPTGLKV